MAEQINADQIRQILENGIAQAQEIMADPSKINELIEQFQQKVKQLPSEAGEALANIPLMIDMVKGYVTRQYTEVSPKVVASLVSAFLYLVTKKDLISDDVPVLGIADDVAVIALAMKINEGELAAFKQWRDAQAPAEGVEA